MAQVKLTPVDDDPFDADQAAMMPETFVPQGMHDWAKQAAPKDFAIIRNAVQGLAALPQRAFESSERSRRGEGYEPGPILDAAMLPMGIAAPFAEAGAAGVFGGRLAQTADLAMMRRAEEALKSGTNAGDVWADTGWFRGPDGKMRFEIPDQPARLTGAPFKQGRSVFGGETYDPLPLPQVLDHPDLYKAYPALKTYQVHHWPYMEGAQMDPLNKTIMVNARSPTAREEILHEVQHGVQDIERFAQGGHPENMDDHPAVQAANSRVQELIAQRHAELEKAVTKRRVKAPKTDVSTIEDPTERMFAELRSALAADRKTTISVVNKKKAAEIEKAFDPRIDAAQMVADLTRHDAYRSLAGEVEARNVMDRSMMGHNSRRGIPPWETADTPLKEQYIVTPVDHDPFEDKL